MRFDVLLISMFTGMMFLIGGIAIISEQNTKYQLNSDNTIFNNLTDDLDKTYGEFNQSIFALDDKSVSEGTAEDDLFSGGFNVLRNIKSYLALPGKLLSSLAIALGVPAFIMNITMIMLGVSIIFGIIYMIFRFQPR